MIFHSTRGKDKDKTFEQVLMQGLADDGGLFIPDFWPKVDIEKLKKLDTFLDVAKYIVPMFTNSSFSDSEVEEVLNNTWHDFSQKDLIKIFDIDESTKVLELFHGPTAAFKDFGLQLAAAFFNKTLQAQNKTAVVFGATSGDTGSAAIDACKEFELIKSFILIPDGNMSEIQRKQMTTVNKPNVFPVLVSGTFDDCQDIVKKGFKERNFLKDDQYLLAVNSINWVRIIGQICYYFYASLKINALSNPLNFSVPTGNFGNVFACYAASKMGMPIEKIIVAVNSNDILDRFFKNNDYSKKIVSETTSPSMDISVASNFERLIYDFYLNRNSEDCSNLYKQFPNQGIKINDAMWQKSRDLFMSYSIDDDSTFDAMKFYNNKYGYVMDPHTAVAAKAINILKDKLKNQTVILSTAHPAKFPNALKKAGISINEIPNNLREVISKKEVAVQLSASDDSIFNYIKENN
jgi:threonine synthase